jgi:hypothetical protein
MHKWKWSIGLSITSLVLAIGMSALGAREYEVDHRLHPEYFYHGNSYYSPAGQWMNYCLNAPPYVFTNLLVDFVMRHHLLPSSWFDHYCFYFVHYEYYLVVFLFWWWVGWKIEVKLASRDSWGLWTTLESLLGIAFSAVLLFYGVTGLANRNLIQAIVVSMVVWGIFLLWYFVLYLWRKPERIDA